MSKRIVILAILTLPLRLSGAEPRTVYIIHYLPSDRTYRPEVTAVAQEKVKRAQAFFAEQMMRHGHGELTFRLAPGVHRFISSNRADYYIDARTGRVKGNYLGTLEEHFDLNENIYVIYRDISDRDSGGFGSRRKKTGGTVSLTASTVSRPGDWKYAAHELGHAFGLPHDFRDNDFIMSYGEVASKRNSISKCAADFLAGNPYFNSAVSTREGTLPTIEFTNALEYDPGLETIPVQLELTAGEGLYQVILIAAAGLQNYGIRACFAFSGEQGKTLTWDYDGKGVAANPVDIETDLANAEHTIAAIVVDRDGNINADEITIKPLGGIAAREFKLTLGSVPHHLWSLEAYTGSVFATRFSPDGTEIVTSGRDIVERGSIRFWTAAGELIRTIRSGSFADLPGDGVIAFSPDGQLLASGVRSGAGGGSIRIWNMRTYELEYTLTGHVLGITSLNFAPPLLFSTADEDSSIWVWDLDTRERISTLKGHTGAVATVDIAPDRDLIASGARGDNEIRMWNLETRRYDFSLTGHTEDIRSLLFANDYLVSGSADRTVKIWELTSRNAARTLRGHTRPVYRLAFTARGNVLASAGDTEIRLWDLDSGRNLAEINEHTGWITSVDFSPDGQTLITGQNDGSVWLWDVAALLESGIIEGDFDKDGTVGFSDFVLFARAFGGEYETLFDLDKNGVIDFSDFLRFVKAFDSK